MVMAVVIMDKQDYSTKAQDLLADKDTYRLITPDSTIKDKNKSMQILRIIKAQCCIMSLCYKGKIQPHNDRSFESPNNY